MLMYNIYHIHSIYNLYIHILCFSSSFLCKIQQMKKKSHRWQLISDKNTTNPLKSMRICIFHCQDPYAYHQLQINLYIIFITNKQEYNYNHFFYDCFFSFESSAFFPKDLNFSYYWFISNFIYSGISSSFCSRSSF